jgi:hypothetical protein
MPGGGRPGLLVALAATALASPVAANAGVLRQPPSTEWSEPAHVVYTDVAGERNNLVFVDTGEAEAYVDEMNQVFLAAGALIYVTDAVITGACTALRPHLRYCQNYVVTAGYHSTFGTDFTFNLGDKDDQFEKHAVFDHYATTVNGPAGNDRIFADDLWGDSITCGSGIDIVYADPFDTVASDCEYVNPPASWLVDVDVTLAGHTVPVHVLRCSALPPAVPCPVVHFGER